MRSTVNSKVKVMSGRKLELDWESVRKGKRSRKAVPRKFTKSGNISPKRVGDFSGSDSDKLAASSVIGRRKSGKKEHVPIKKRRQLIGSRATPPDTGVDDLARAVCDNEFSNETIAKRVKEESLTWDFSGIELLATAATMEACADKVDRDVGDSSIPGSSDAPELGLKRNESRNSCSTTTMCADNGKCSGLNKCTSLSPCVSSKVERRFWDLNTDMEAWVEPSDDSNAREQLPNSAVAGVKSFALKQEDKLGDAPDSTSCSKSTNLEVKPEKISHSSDAIAIKKDVDGSGDADMKTPGQVITADAILDGVQTILGAEITGAAVLKKDSENSYEAQGTIKDQKCVDSTVQSDKTCVTGLTTAEQEKLVKHEDNDLPKGLGKAKLEDSCNSYSTRPHDNFAVSVGKVDMTMDPRPDSPYEDGELRESFLYDWEENEETELVDYESDGRREDSDGADNIGSSEIVEGGSEGSHGSEGIKYPLTSGIKESDGGSGTTVDHSMEMAVDEDPMRGRYLTNRSGMDDCKALMGEYVSRMAREKIQSRTEPADDKDAFYLPQYRSRHPGPGGFRDRDATPDKYVGKSTPVAYRNGRGGVNQWNNNWGSRNRYASDHQRTEGFNSARPRRNFTGESIDRFDGQNFHEQRQTGDYLSRDMNRPFVSTRSPMERDNRFSTGQKMPPARRFNNYRGTHYQQSGDFEPVTNGPAALVRFSRVPGRDRSFSPNSVKDGHMPSLPLNRRSSRSRSRTRSPRSWHSYREASFGNRRHIDSPDFRPEARMERVKVPFHKPKFTPEYREGREGYMSPARGRFPAQRNSRWVGDRSFGNNNDRSYGDNNDRSFGDNHLKRRRSPTGAFRFNNQNANSPGRFKSDEYYRPMVRPSPRRFPFAENDDRKTKFETMYDDEKLENKGEMYRPMQRGYGGNYQRFQRDGNNDFETRNLNNEEGVGAPVLRDVAQVQGAGEDKKESEI